MSEELGYKIKKFREVKNFTQDYMAKKLGITQGSYSAIESGKTRITPEKLNKIADILEVSGKMIVGFNKGFLYGNYIPISEHTKIIDEMKKLYEQIIQQKKAENEALRNRLDNTENKHKKNT